MGFAAIAAGVLSAQSVKISPGYVTLPLGGSQKYIASTTGLQPEGVIWKLYGTGTGSIDQTGLYKAPTVMPKDSVLISATSIADGKTQALQYIGLAYPGPTITSAAPNPIIAGQYNVTIAGSGFKTGATVLCAGIQLTTTALSATSITGSGGWVSSSTKFLSCGVKNSDSTVGNLLTIPVTAPTSDGSGGGSGPGSGGGTSAPTIAPASASVVLGATQQFTGTNVTSWAATAGTITSGGLYTAPSAMTVTGKDTVTATGAGGSVSATVTLISNVPPTISNVTPATLPIGPFSMTIAGTGFIPTSTVMLGTTALTVAAGGTTTSLTVSGFGSTPGLLNLTVANGPVASQPVPVQVGLSNPLVSAAAARRFLEQAAFGPTPNDALHVQQVGFQGYLNEQFALPRVSNFNGLGSQGGMPTYFIANAVTNSDQLRQRVGFALSQIFVTSLNKLIWNDYMIPYQQMLMDDAFTNYRQLLYDVTLSPAMGQFLDMANNGKANPATGSVANENYAREIMQLFSLGTAMLNPDGTVQLDANNIPVPTYIQTNITELARVFTGWTYAPAPGGSVIWNAYQNTNGPMVPYAPQHDTGAKNLLLGYVSPAGISAQQDLNNALDNIFNHPNIGPFVAKNLIQHLVKSNPSPAYVQRVAAVFADNGVGVRGDMKAILTAILLDPEARGNDAGGNDQVTDGHLQEPALFIAGLIRAFGGTASTQNYFAWDLTNLSQDLYNPASVFNFFSPSYRAPGTGGLYGPEFQIDSPNTSIYRSNLVNGIFASSWNNPVQGYGPGTGVDFTPFVALASNPAGLVSALDLTLTHGTMPAGMKSIITTAVTNDSNGNVSRVQTGIILIATSSYYGVWH
jgi:hypothetical protein